MRRLLPQLFLIAALLCSSCAGPLDRYEPIPDLLRYEQSVAAYVAKDGPVFSPALQERMAEAFLEGHFAPWRRGAPVHGRDEAFFGLKLVENKEFFGENKLPLGSGWRAEMRRLSDPGGFPGLGLPAVTTVNSSLRVLPTSRPAFYDFREAGEGFPFDMMQNSAIWAGTPIYLTHVSADGAWYLAECRYAFGWIAARDVALVDRAALEALSAGPLVTPVKDRVPLVDETGRHRFELRIGQVLSGRKTFRGGYELLVPVRNADGRARLVAAEVGPGLVRPWPLPANKSAMAALADAMIGQAYGWGGLYANRDCSATLLDLFAAFGAPLPRNSRMQAAAGERIEFEGLEPEEKRALVIEKGEAFRTLLAKPGHVMLYIGVRGGEPLVFHTAWGLMTESPWGREGRRIIGVTAVTSLAPGRGVEELARPEGVFLERLSSMTFIGRDLAKGRPDHARVE